MPAPHPRLLALLALVVGCDDTSKKPMAKAPAPVQTRATLNRTTQDIRRAAPELAKGAIVSTGEITETNPIAVQGNAYVATTGRLAVMQVGQLLEIYRAQNDDKYPKDFDEFMTGVIKANNVALPMLPYYQEYGYDEERHKLVVLEYPALKAQREKERDAK